MKRTYQPHHRRRRRTPWFPSPHEDSERTQGPQQTPSQGPPPSDRLETSVSDGRIRTRQDFKTLFETATSFRGHLVVLLLRPHPDPETRVAFVAGRRVGGAVERNRCRRLLREAYRMHRPHTDLHARDIGLIARPACAKAKVHDVLRELEELYRRAEVWRVDRHPES